MVYDVVVAFPGASVAGGIAILADAALVHHVVGAPSAVAVEHEFAAVREIAIPVAVPPGQIHIIPPDEPSLVNTDTEFVEDQGLLPPIAARSLLA